MMGRIKNVWYLSFICKDGRHNIKYTIQEKEPLKNEIDLCRLQYADEQH